MNSQIHDGGKRLQFGSSSPVPAFRHPYEKYNSRISNDSFYLSSDHNQGRGSDGPDPGCRRSHKSGQDARENGAKGLEERNTLICQTFLTENPFFGAYYPAIRPRSVEGNSNKGSERSRSVSTDFDDSKTYKIIYTGDSATNNLPGNKLKKSDDIHHFHEHHHFFHDKNDETSNSTYYDKYQFAKAKEQTKSTIADPNKSFLKQPIQESCMIYQIEEDGTQILDDVEPGKEKSQEGPRHSSRSSSKSGKKSSDNETYTVVCEHCQKLLRDYPNARIIGHENIPKKFSIESYDRRTYVPHGYESVQKTNWKPANIFVAEPQYQVHRMTLSPGSSRQRKEDKTYAKLMERSSRSRRSSRRLSQFKSAGDRGEVNRNQTKPKISSRKLSMNDSDSRSIIFKCDHCKSIIENYPGPRKRIEASSSSSSSSSSIDRGFDEKTKESKSKQKGTLLSKSSAKGSAATKRSSIVSERKSSSYKGLKGSRTSDKEKSSGLRVSSKVSSPKLSKAYPVTEKKKSPVQRASRPPSVMGRRRSSSYNAFRDTGSGAEKPKPGYKKRRASSEMTKRNSSSRKGSRDSAAPDKRITSGLKEPKDSNESKPKSSSYKECSVGMRASSSKKPSRESALLDKGVNHKKSITSDKKSCPTYKESGILCTPNTRSSSNRKESKDSGLKKVTKTESDPKKVEKEKSRAIKTEDRSMQTSSRKLICAQESAVAKRSSTATKTGSRNANAEEPRKSGTAPGGLASSGSNNPYVKSSTVRGSATLSRRTVASKDTHVIQVESTPETKQSSKVTGIQTEITDLKSQLDRLEAMHNMKVEAPDSSSNATREAIDCPKHPIVVCTSTTYIMTKCANDCGDRKSTTATPKGSEKIQPKQSDTPPAQCNPAEDASAPKCNRFCCTERVATASAEKPTKPKCYLGNYCPPSKAGQTRPNCQLVGARITRAINKVCHCPNRDLLSKYCDSPVRTRSCDRGDICRRLFGNGKNQRRNWLRGGLLTSYCNDRERRSHHCCHCPTNSNDAIPDIKESLHRSYSDTECGSERLIAYRSYSKVLRDYKLDIENHDDTTEKEFLVPQAAVEDEVEIDESSRAGYFLRTSISDVCEYRNGSLIRLIGKSGWIVYTKKLFLEGKDKDCNGSVEEFSKNFDEFIIFPAGTSTSYSKSNTNVKDNAQKSDESQEGKFLLLSDRQVLSDSSIYLPLAVKMLNERSAHAKKDNGTSSVYLSSNLRLKNRGISDIHDDSIEKIDNFPNELYLLDCKSAADRTATCKDVSGYGQRCTCRRRRQNERETGAKKQKKEKIPILFEEMKSPRNETKERRMSDISLKYVYAEKSRGSEKANKVTWSTDRSGSRTKKPCLFGVSRCKKNRRSREHFSMNDKQRKHRWHRSTTQKTKGSNYNAYTKPQGDSPQNRCACCNCSPNHACSAACEREEEELTGIRKLLKDIGISGLTFGLSRKTASCRPGFVKPQNVEEKQNESPDESYSEDVQENEVGEMEVTEEVKEEITREEEIGSSITDLKKLSPEDKCCDCVKQLEQLLTQAEFFKQPPPEPISLKQESWERMWNVDSRKPSTVSTKKEPSINPEVLDDISLQRRRIAECENLLRQFEMQLEDVKRQREAYACKCEETPRQDEAPEGPVQCDDVELELLKDPKCQIPKDDGYIRFEGKILTQLNAKKSTKSIGCGGANDECKKPSSAVHSPPKTFMVRNAAQMTSDILLRPKDSQESEQFIKSVNLDVEENNAKAKRKSEDCTHVCCMLPPKIEISCERTMCACEKCCNIHYVDKHYLPTNCFKKCPGRESEKKEVFTNTSVKSVSLHRRDECTSVNNVFKSKKSDSIVTMCRRRREEAPLCRPSTRDEGTLTIHRSRKNKGTSVMCRRAKDEATSTMCHKRKDEATSAIAHMGKDEATSTLCRTKKDEATSTLCWPRKDEAVSSKSIREDPIPRMPHKETSSSAAAECLPVKSTYKGKTDEAISVHFPESDEVLETDESRLRKESEGVSEKERFVNQSDLDKSPSDGDKGDESSSKDLSHKSSVKSRTRDVICECSKTSATDNCEGHVDCDCASKNISCAEKRKAKRFCDCGSKLKLIEDRLRALEERKRLSSSATSSAKERKETTEESSISSEKARRVSSASSIISEKEPETSSETSLGNQIPRKGTSEELNVSYKREKQSLEEVSSVNQGDKASNLVEPEKARQETTESSSLTEKSSSLENLESETDAEIKTKVITCNNLNFFNGGDPNVKTKCQCMEDTFCPFKYYQGQQDLTTTKNIFFLTDIDLLRQWSGMYGCAEYSYCKNFWNVNESALKPVKLPRDWRNVKTAVASFFRSCKLRKKKFTFKRRKKSGGESSVSGASSRSNISSGSKDSFIDDCSRSSMPLKRRSFHVLAKSPRPVRPAKERRKNGSDKKRRKKSRKRKIHS